MGRFSGVENEEPTERGRHFKVGMYVLQINKLLSKAKRKGKEIFFVGEMTALWTNAECEVQPPATVSFYQQDSWDGWLGRVRKFVSSLADVPLADVNEDVMEGAVSEANPYGGWKVFAEAEPNEENPAFPYIKFWPYRKDWDPLVNGGTKYPNGAPIRAQGAAPVARAPAQQPRTQQGQTREEPARPAPQQQQRRAPPGQNAAPAGRPQGQPQQRTQQGGPQQQRRAPPPPPPREPGDDVDAPNGYDENGEPIPF